MVLLPAGGLGLKFYQILGACQMLNFYFFLLYLLLDLSDVLTRMAMHLKLIARAPPAAPLAPSIHHDPVHLVRINHHLLHVPADPLVIYLSATPNALADVHIG